MTTNLLKARAAFWTITLGITLPFLTRAAGPVQWTIEYGGNGHYYQAVSATNGISWEQASQAAGLLGGYLATVTSAEENEFIYNNLVSVDDSLWNTDSDGNGIGPWLGGWQPPGASEPAGGWTWVTGETFSYNAWASAQPDDTDGVENRIHYIAVHGAKDKAWNDYPNDPAKSARQVINGYIVEWSSDPSAAPGGKVAVYRIAASYTRTGDEKVEQASVNGYMLFDLISNNVVVVRVDAVKKLFRESTPTVSIANINASGGRTITAIKFQSHDLVTALAKGQNLNVTVNYDAFKHPLNVSIPSAFTVGGSDLLVSLTGETVSREYHGSIALDRVATLAANKKGYDVTTYLAALQTELVGKGYSAVP
jgi:hypothetical protein